MASLQVGTRVRKGVCLVEAPAGSIQGKNMGSPDEVRSFDKGKMDVVALDNVTVGKATFEPGWRWSEAVKPIAGTDSCQVPHVGYEISGNGYGRWSHGYGKRSDG